MGRGQASGSTRPRRGGTSLGDLRYILTFLLNSPALHQAAHIYASDFARADQSSPFEGAAVLHEVMGNHSNLFQAAVQLLPILCWM